VCWKVRYVYPLVDVDMLVKLEVQVAKIGIGNISNIGG